MTFKEIWDTYEIHRDELSEYAGKMEYDNELTRENAEAETAYMMQQKHLLFIQGEFWK